MTTRHDLRLSSILTLCKYSHNLVFFNKNKIVHYVGRYILHLASCFPVQNCVATGRYWTFNIICTYI